MRIWWVKAMAAVMAVGAPWYAGAQDTPQPGLPTVPLPEGATPGNYVQIVQAYAAQFAVLGGLVISTVAFLIVAKNVIQKYAAIADNRATWGELGLHLGAGVVLLVLVVYLATQAAPILTPT